MTDVAGKTIYITGGCSGTGLAAGKMLARLGAHIVILDLSPSEPALREIGLARRAANQLVAGYRINIADRKIAMGAVALAAAECGAPDILINMAGIAVAEEFINMTSETFDRVMQVNVYGTRNIVEAVLPFMISRGSGKLVLAGSMGGILPVYGYTAYGTSEFAVVGLAQCLRCELKPRGISIACFCPGEMETPGLAQEHRMLHPATRALMEVVGTMPPEAAARDLVKGIRNNRFLIIPGLKMKLIWWLYRLTPVWLWNSITDSIVAKALRRNTAVQNRVSMGRLL
jgi:NAD(P)-dependent dehydrogenase (short-subunit alcohol dehydrogenase family)